MVDIILPIYNPNEDLLKSIKSIVDQTYTDWNLYIVDDCSTNDYFDKVRNDLLMQNSKIFYFRRNKNSRAASCRNYAIRKGNADYIAFIDQDDIWDSNKLEKQIEYFNLNDVDAVHGNLLFIDENDNFTRFDWSTKENNSRRDILWTELSNSALADLMLYRPNIRIISSVVKRTAFEKIGGFKEQFFGGEDELFWFEIAKHGRIGYLDKILFYRREHQFNTVSIFKMSRLIGYYSALGYLNSKYKDVNRIILKKKREGIAYDVFSLCVKKHDMTGLIKQRKMFIENASFISQKLWNTLCNKRKKIQH